MNGNLLFENLKDFCVQNIKTQSFQVENENILSSRGGPERGEKSRCSIFFFFGSKPEKSSRKGKRFIKKFSSSFFYKTHDFFSNSLEFLDQYT